MATPDLPVETIIGNLAEEALVHYWKDRETKQLSQQDKYYEKYASKNCPYRQKFVRPTITLSSLLSHTGVEKKHAVPRPITPSEYQLLATKTHVESKTSPHNPNSILYYTKGEIIVPRWPENKIKIVRDPTVSPQAPANPYNSYNITHRPPSPQSPTERHSMRPTSSGRPKSRNGRAKVPEGLSQYSGLIQNLQSKMTEEEQQAIDRIQQSLLAATRDFEMMNKGGKSRSPSPKQQQQRPQSREGSKLDSVRNNLSNSFNGAVSRPTTASGTAAVAPAHPSRLSPIASKVRQHYNIMEEFLDIATASNDILIDGDFDLDFRNDWETNNKAASEGLASRPLSSVDRNGYQKLALPDFDLHHLNRQQYLQQQMQWNDYASNVIAQNTQLFNSMHHPTNSSSITRDQEAPPEILAMEDTLTLDTSVDEPQGRSAAAAAPTSPSVQSPPVASGHAIPNLVVMINDPLDLTAVAAEESVRTLHRHPSTHSPKASSPSHNSSFKGGAGRRRPSLEKSDSHNSHNGSFSGGRRPSLENNKSTSHADARRASRRSMDNVATTPKHETSNNRPMRPHSASRTSPSYTAGGRRQSLTNSNNLSPGGTSPSSPKAGTLTAGLTRQTPRDLRKNKKQQQQLPDSPEAVGEEDDSLRHHSHHSPHHHHNHVFNDGDVDVPLEYIDAISRAPTLNPAIFQTTRHARKKRHGMDPDGTRSPMQSELEGEDENNSALDEGSQEETALEALYSVSQQVMQAVQSLNSANPVVIKPKHLLLADPYAAAAGSHDEPGDVITMSPLHPVVHPGKANMLNMFSEMKMKTLKKTPNPGAAKLATVSSAAIASAAATKALSPKAVPPQVSHLDTYNEFCFDVARLGFEIISMRDVSMTKAIGRGKFAAVYEAQLRTVARPTNTNGSNNALLNSSGTLFIGPISIHHVSYNEHSETVALKIAQFEGNDPYFNTPNGVVDAHEGPGQIQVKPAALPPLASITEFQRELHALRELAGHKNIVKVRGCSISPLAIAMELVEFGNLHANMAKMDWQEETTLRDRISYMLDICDGLAHMHSRLYVHRDIKPHNILLGVSYPDGHTICKIADLGTAVKLTDANELLHEQIGTTGYSAPEIFSTKGYSFPVDVFASAVLFWELLGTTRTMRDNILMGHDPYEAVEMMESGVRPLFHVNNDYHNKSELRAAIEKAWSTSPEDRPTIAALRTAIAACPPI